MIADREQISEMLNKALEDNQKINQRREEEFQRISNERNNVN